jgi:hypothetical protein
MKKVRNINAANKHKRALKASRRRKAFVKQKEQWKLGIGLYEKYTQEKRDQLNKL